MTNYAKLEFRNIEAMKAFFAEQAGRDLTRKIAKQRPNLNGLSPADENELVRIVRVLYLAVIEQGRAWDVTKRWIHQILKDEVQLPLEVRQRIINRAINSPYDDTLNGLSGVGSITLYTSGTNVNIRKGPGTNYETVKRIAASNSPLTFLSKTAKDKEGFTWLQVAEGWVRQDLVSTKELSDQEIRFSTMLRNDQLIYLNLVKMSAHYSQIYSNANQRWPLPAVGTPGREAIVQARTDYFTKTGYFRFKDIYNRYQVRQDDFRNNKTYNIGKSLTQWGDTIVNLTNPLWIAQTWFLNALNGLSGGPSLLIPVLLIVGATITAVAIAYFLTKHEKSVQVDLADSADNLLKLQNADPATMKAYVDITKAQIDANKEVAEDQNHNWLDSLGEGGKIVLGVVGSVAGAAGVYYLAQRIIRDAKASKLKKTRRTNTK